MPKGVYPRKPKVQAAAAAATSEPGTGPSGSAVVGTGVKDRIAMLNEIAAQNFQARVDGGEASPVEPDETPVVPQNEPEAPVVEVPPPSDAPPTPSQTETPAPEVTPEAPVSKKTYKLTINGEQQEVDEDTVLALAQKVGAADQYLAKASEAWKAAQQAHQAPAPQPMDDAALARALQNGGEEALEAVRQIRASQADPVSLVDKRLSLALATAKFQQDYPDVVSDPYLLFLAESAAAEMERQSDQRPYAQRFAAIGDGIRKWKGSFAAPVASMAEKEQRKATVVPIKSAQARATVPIPTEQAKTTEQIVAEMNANRGRRQV